MLHPSCDVVNHKNATARVTVTGSIRVKLGFKPRFEPELRCPCERGDSDIMTYSIWSINHYCMISDDCSA